MRFSKGFRSLRAEELNIPLSERLHTCWGHRDRACSIVTNWLLSFAVACWADMPADVLHRQPGCSILQNPKTLNNRLNPPKKLHNSKKKRPNTTPEKTPSKPQTPQATLKRPKCPRNLMKPRQGSRLALHRAWRVQQAWERFRVL